MTSTSAPSRCRQTSRQARRVVWQRGVWVAAAIVASSTLFAASGPRTNSAATVELSWPQFRGPHRNGISTETGLTRAFPAGGPRTLWRVAGGEGYSGLVVDAGRLFTLYARGDDELLAAHDANSGATLWSTKLDRTWRDGQGNGPRSTPVVDGTLVYGLSARGVLVAAEVASGKVIWRKDLAAEYGAVPPQWGISTALAIEDDLLLVDAGGRPGFGVLALEKATGALRWSADSDVAGYSMPVRVTVEGIDQLIFFRGTRLIALAPKDGKVLWRLPWKTDYDVNAATPIFVPPNRLLVSSGYGTGSALLQLEVKGGQASPVEVWRNKVLKSQFSSPVVRGGHVYGFDNKVLKAIDLATGEERWKQSGLGHGSLIWADGMLVVLSERGRLVLVDAKPDAYRELAASEPLTGKCWTAPTLLAGKLYLRNEKEIVCLDLAAQ